MKTIEQQLEI